MKERYLNQVACPFCGFSQDVLLPAKDALELRPICMSCGRMYLVTLGPKSLFGRRRQVFPL